jgi:X-Pro dipeptidyl-peptidase (S15 family)/X-Pro dipeptidyl-peptidase C-terminal non-catalytic domain
MLGRSVAQVPQWKWLVAALAVIGVLVVAPAAQAVTPERVFGNEVGCETLPANGNIRYCHGFVFSNWQEKTKIDVNVFLPPESDGAGPFPTIGDFHGWGSAKLGLEEENGGFTQAKDARIQGWAEQGYAVFSMSDRGWGLSCGALDPQKVVEAVCGNGYNHLMDDRYEVRDAQFLLSELADEGLVQPNKIGATGASYGGGMSIALAALRNRTMLQDGSLIPWESPEGKAMELAAAVPQWPWTDLSSALAPNGRNLDYVTNSPYRGPDGKLPIGVMKLSFDKYLYGAGLLLSNYNEADPQADIPGWIERLEGGDPYTDSTINAIIEQLSTFHSSFGIKSSVEPSPLLIQNGWNDDLFPVDEALRFYQRTRSQYPSDPISLYLADIGHARSQNKAADVAAFNQRLDAWFGHYLKGEGTAPSSSVEALTTTCSTPSEGPYTAANWSSLAPGEVRLQSGGAQTIGHRGAAEERSAAEAEEFNEASAVFDPIVGPKIGKTVCSSVPDTEQPLSANYRLGAAPAGGYTLMGSPTIIANIDSPSPNSEIAARLVDVSPEGTETLIARGLYRPNGGPQEMVFQLHPQAYHFAAGHVPKLELLSSDVPYGRWSNLQTNVTVNSLELRLPVMDQPGALGGLVQTPAPKVVPPGYTLATEFEQKTTPPTPPASVTPAPKAVTPAKVGFGGIAGKLTANGKALIVPVRCSSDGACTGSLSFSTKKSGKKASTMIARGNYTLAVSTATNVKVPLTKAGSKLVKEGIAAKQKKLAGVLQLQDVGRANTLTLNRAAQLPRGK